jgi:hypothetical protein
MHENLEGSLSHSLFPSNAVMSELLYVDSPSEGGRRGRGGSSPPAHIPECGFLTPSPDHPRHRRCRLLIVTTVGLSLNWQATAFQDTPRRDYVAPRSIQSGLCGKPFAVASNGHIVCNGSQASITGNAGDNLSFSFFDSFYHKGFPDKRTTHGYEIRMSLLYDLLHLRHSP